MDLEGLLYELLEVKRLILFMTVFSRYITSNTSVPGEGVLLGILGGGVPPGSLNPDSIQRPKMSFSAPVFRPDL